MLLLAASGGLLAAGQSPAESFPEFLDRFAKDGDFRLSRIEFPLHATLGNTTDPRIRVRWSREQLDGHFVVPVATDRLEAEGLQQNVQMTSASTVVVSQSRPQSDSYLLLYSFKQRKGKWFLVEFDDSSY